MAGRPWLLALGSPINVEGLCGLAEIWAPPEPPISCQIPKFVFSSLPSWRMPLKSILFFSQCILQLRVRIHKLDRIGGARQGCKCTQKRTDNSELGRARHRFAHEPRESAHLLVWPSAPVCCRLPRQCAQPSRAILQKASTTSEAKVCVSRHTILMALVLSHIYTKKVCQLLQASGPGPDA